MAEKKHTDDSLEEKDRDEGLKEFLDQASEAMDDGGGPTDPKAPVGEPQHRRLRVIVSEDRMEAQLEGVFPDTKLAEVQEALKRERVIWGVQEESLKKAVVQADSSGRHQRDIPAAKGKPAVYLKRKQVEYPFLEGLRQLGTGEPVHIASSVLREIDEVMGYINIGQIRRYGHPIVAVTARSLLMEVQGEDVIEPGRDVFGKPVRTVVGEEPSSLKAGVGVIENEAGSITSKTFGYISVIGGSLSVVSPIWISQDRLEAYFINPPHLGERKVPDPEEILEMLKALKIGVGIDREAIAQMCSDLKQGDLRESCVRIARGQPPMLSKGQIIFGFDPLPPARFEEVKETLKARDFEKVAACEIVVQAVHEGEVLAEQAGEGAESGPGKDLFGESVALPEDLQEQKLYKAGINVRREVEGGLLRFVSEIFGYAGVLDDHILVVPPIHISPDKMEVHFVELPQGQKPVLPTTAEIERFLENARVRHGVDSEAVAGLSEMPPTDEVLGTQTVLLSRGTPPEPEQSGRVELLFKQRPDPGKLLEAGSIDFRERDAVPQVKVGELLARRTLPIPGKVGKDVRGRVVQPPKQEPQRLSPGPNVVAKEETGDQLFYATSPGWPRVMKDTLSVMNLYRHRGDVGYQTGNLHLEGDAEIKGTVKSRFRVEATGDVHLGGAVERGGQVTAQGNVVVLGGIIGAKVKAGGDLYVRFIQDSEVKVGGDLVVRNNVQDSTVEVKKRATVQGNEGGKRQLCLLGGSMVAGWEIDAVSIGSGYRRKTKVVVGVDIEMEASLVKYRKGLAFSDLRSRRAMRALEELIGRSGWKRDPMAAIRRVAPGRRKFLVNQLKEIDKMKKLKGSLEYHVEKMGKNRAKNLDRALVKASGMAFKNAIVQIGNIYKILDEDIWGVSFHMNPEHTQVVQESL